MTSHDENVPFQCSKSGSRDLNATLNPQNLIPSPVSLGFATNRFQILLFPGNLKVQFFFKRYFNPMKNRFCNNEYDSRFAFQGSRDDQERGLFGDDVIATDMT